MEQKQTSQNNENIKEKECNGTIYGLMDPESGQLKYVGQTINLAKRFCKHISDAKHHKSPNKLCSWVQILLLKNKKPAIHIIEQNIPQSELNLRERFYIKILRQTNDLFNITDGGDGGGSKYNMPPSHRKATSKGLKKYYSEHQHHMRGKKLPQETVEKIAKTMTGKKHPHKGHTISKDTKEKIRKNLKPWDKGKHWDEEHIQKMREIQSRPEVIEKKRKALLGVKKSEETKLKTTGNKNGMYNKKPWNTGLTRETDERIRKIGLKLKGNKFSVGRKHSKETIMKSVLKIAKLTFDEVIEIRLKFTLGSTTKQLAKEYGIHYRYVEKLINKKARAEY